MLRGVRPCRREGADGPSQWIVGHTDGGQTVRVLLEVASLDDATRDMTRRRITSDHVAVYHLRRLSSLYFESCAVASGRYYSNICFSLAELLRRAKVHKSTSVVVNDVDNYHEQYVKHDLSIVHTYSGPLSCCYPVCACPW